MTAKEWLKLIKAVEEIEEIDDSKDKQNELSDDVVSQLTARITAMEKAIDSDKSAETKKEVPKEPKEHIPSWVNDLNKRLDAIEKKQPNISIESKIDPVGIEDVIKKML